jgi:hypothetical protein
MLGMYRGLVPAIMFQMVGNSTRFGVYYAGKRYVGVDKALDSRTNLMLGLTAGSVAGLIACPFFTLKTILQAQAEPKGLMVVTAEILRVQGIPGLFAGLPAFVVRCV